MKNRLLDLSATADPKAQLQSPTPQFFSANGVDYEFDLRAKCDRWIKFLQSLWGDDDESIALLQEWFGYCLLPDTSQQKLAMIIGPSRSGKGTIASVLSHVIGKLNVAAPTLGSLPGQFGLWPLVGKSLAIIGDARLSGRVDAVAVVERLLSISGEDLQNVDRKNLVPLNGVRLPVRFLILSNELPNLNDASGAIMSRILLLKMTRSFLGCEDKNLCRVLLEELPGILNWAIEGWVRLNDRGYFAEPKSSRELVDDLSRIASPINEFVSDCCQVEPDRSVATKLLYHRWREWCEEQGRDRPGSIATFGKNIRAAVPSIQRVRAKAVFSKSRPWMYMGIALKPGDASLSYQS
jgi:putative DNA primase/helicase